MPAGHTAEWYVASVFVSDGGQRRASIPHTNHEWGVEPICAVGMQGVWEAEAEAEAEAAAARMGAASRELKQARNTVAITGGVSTMAAPRRLDPASCTARSASVSSSTMVVHAVLGQVRIVTLQGFRMGNRAALSHFTLSLQSLTRTMSGALTRSVRWECRGCGGRRRRRRHGCRPPPRRWRRPTIATSDAGQREYVHA